MFFHSSECRLVMYRRLLNYINRNTCIYIQVSICCHYCGKISTWTPPILNCRVGIKLRLTIKAGFRVRVKDRVRLYMYLGFDLFYQYRGVGQTNLSILQILCTVVFYQCLVLSKFKHAVLGIHLSWLSVCVGQVSSFCHLLMTQLMVWCTSD